MFFIVPNIAVCLLLRWVRTLPAARKLKETNEIAGFYVTVIGAIYAVVLAFMLVAVWERFEDAEKTAASEANLVQDVYRLAGGLPAPECQAIRNVAREYVDSVRHEEWSAMGSTITRAHPYNRYVDKMWNLIIHLKADSTHDGNLIDHLQDRFISMNDMRRLRWERAANSLPPLLWSILLFGGILTVGFCALFGMEKYALHAFKTVLLSLLVFSMLFAVWELDLPFQRELTVSSEAFDQAVERFQYLDQEATAKRLPEKGPVLVRF
jgi:hypothetical protein